MPGIFRRTGTRATRRLAMAFAVASLGMAASTTGCGSRTSSGSARGPEQAVRTLPAAQALVLRTSGSPLPDTSVTFRAGEPRTIVLRYGPPDNLAFAELHFPPPTFAADSGRDITVRLHPTPGLYRLQVDASAKIGEGATVTFRYSRFFTAPPEAREAYSSDVAFEQALAVAHLTDNETLRFLPSARPAADALQAPLPSAGTYLVAAVPAHP